MIVQDLWRVMLNNIPLTPLLLPALMIERHSSKPSPAGGNSFRHHESR